MRILTFILTIFFSLTLSAQKRNRDVVYLKNGSILRGTIVLLEPGRLIKLKTADNNIWVFDQDKIDSIVRPEKIRIPQGKGYFNLTEMGVLVGNSTNYKNAPFTLMNISSWKFENGFSTGIGVGVEFFNETYLPVVADFRYFIRKAGAIPFVSLQGGYSIPLGGTYTQLNLYYLSSSIYRPTPQPTNIDVSARGGWLVNPAIGIQTPLMKILHLLLVQDTA